jgi:hypothetical protein
MSQPPTNLDDLKSFVIANFEKLDTGRVVFADNKGEVTWSYPAPEKKQGGCQRCHSERVLGINAKCSDMCSIRMGSNESEGYAPSAPGIGGGDYIETDICLDCGQVQGKFPLKKLEEEEEWEEEATAASETDDDEEDEDY